MWDVGASGVTNLSGLKPAVGLVTLQRHGAKEEDEIEGDSISGVMDDIFARDSELVKLAESE